MKRFETVYIIKDGTSKAQLVKAIKEYENIRNINVLKVFVDDNHLIITVFDKISVCKWYIDDVQDFILNGFKSYNSDLLECL